MKENGWRRGFWPVLTFTRQLLHSDVWQSSLRLTVGGCEAHGLIKVGETIAAAQCMTASDFTV